jgi:hypothetical protein
LQQRLLLSGIEPWVELDGLLDARRRRALVLVHEPEHGVELFRVETECCRQRLDDLRRRPIVAALDLAQVRVGDARHSREVALRNLCQPALRSYEVAKRLKLVVAVGHSESMWRSAVFDRL